MSAYILKLIAIITMVFDHTGYLIYHSQLSWMNYIGRIAFPIFAFQISEGYIHTHNLKKYFIRLAIFAIISEIPYIWFGYCFFSKPSINIIFTLILGLASITLYEMILKQGNSKSKNIKSSYRLLGIIVAIFIAIFAEMFGFDYGYYGVFLIFLYYLFRNNKLLMNISVTILTFIYYMPYFMATNFSIKYIGLFCFSLLPLVFISLYNGKKGKDKKMLFYIFYPVHLIVLCLIYTILHI